MIDEKKLIEELRMEYECVDDLSDFACGAKRGLVQAISIIKHQPKVGEWIPVEEREPSCSCMCLTWIKAKATYNQYEKCVLANYYDGFFDVFPYIDDEPNEVQILAWRPLPEPFKGD